MGRSYVECGQFSPEELFDRDFSNAVDDLVQSVVRPLVVIEDHVVLIDDVHSGPVSCLWVVGVHSDFVETKSRLDGYESLGNNVEHALEVSLARGIITAVDLLGVVTPEVSGVESTAVVLDVDLCSWDVKKSRGLEKRSELIGSLRMTLETEAYS